VRSLIRATAAVAAIVVLDATITFTNVWPTPFVRWAGDVSVELAVIVLALAAALASGYASPDSRRLARWLSVAWVVLAVGRYADVTAPSLWGRDLNFYWDLRFLPDVAGMFVGASHRAMLLGLGATTGVVVLVSVLYLAVRWSFRQLLGALAHRAGRALFGAAAAAIVVGFVLQVVGYFGLDILGEERRIFPRPVTAVYARQAKLVAQAVSRSADLPPGPSFDASLTRLRGADVFLLFVESYGAVTFERPALAERLVGPRAALMAAITDTGRDVVSAFVESPTFGGSSWFAHITLLSGVKVADPDTNALLMTEHRPTMVTNFVARGYRTIAVMPGLWYPWPEGAFYGFQDLYNGPKLEYKGPPFGWWDMPDQVTLAKMDHDEVNRPSRQPLFVFFPTVTTHTPFMPLPPYQADWTRVLTSHPFDEADLARAYGSEPDWFNLSPAYVDSVAYAYETFAGYVRQRAGRDYVLILIGDHQPPALVSGPGATWDVPIHVITNRREVLDGLAAHGFVRGLTPVRPHAGQMHEIVPTLLDAMSGTSR
jgi:phosphoglycerol transferase MdoB-like AlkP superfamily enzyme